MKRLRIKYLRNIGTAFGMSLVLFQSAGTALAQAALPIQPQGGPKSSISSRLAEQSAAWWQVMLSMPASVNPLLDTTGQNCATGQRGSVWLLAGALSADPVVRTCSLPEGENLFFPVINELDINVTSQTAAELRAEIAPCIDAVTTLAVEVDGVAIPSEKIVRIQSAAFAATVPQNGLLDPGIYSPVVDDGYYVLLKALTIGEHTLHVVGATPGCPVFQSPVSVDVTYSLTVVPVNLK